MSKDASVVGMAFAKEASGIIGELRRILGREMLGIFSFYNVSPILSRNGLDKQQHMVTVQAATASLLSQMCITPPYLH